MYTYLLLRRDKKEWSFISLKENIESLNYLEGGDFWVNMRKGSDYEED